MRQAIPQTESQPVRSTLLPAATLARGASPANAVHVRVSPVPPSAPLAPLLSILGCWGTNDFSRKSTPRRGQHTEGAPEGKERETSQNGEQPFSFLLAACAWKPVMMKDVGRVDTVKTLVWEPETSRVRLNGRSPNSIQPTGKMGSSSCLYLTCGR